MPVQNLKKLLDKINKCANYEMLFCLEEEFNSIGLTLQPTKQNKMILCTIVDDGVPSASRIFEDYIHIGSIEDRSQEVPKRLLECIRDFALDKADEPKTVKRTVTEKSWQNSQNSLYGGFTSISGGDLNLSEISDEPVVQIRSTWAGKTITIGDLAEDLDKDSVKDSLLTEENIKKMSKLLED